MQGEDDAVIFVDAATQIENLGDDIILRQLLRGLEQRGRVRVDVSRVPLWAREVIEIDPGTSDDRGRFSLEILRAGLRRRLGRDRGRVFLFLKPGHIGGRYGLRFGLGRVGLLGLTLLCRALGVQVARLGFSVNDCHGALLPIERVQSRAQHLYAPRDDVSVAYAREVGIRVNGRSADLAYTLGVDDHAGKRRSGVVLSFAASTDGHPQPAYAGQLFAFLRSYLDTVPADDVTWCAQVVRDTVFGDRVLSGIPAVTRIGFERDASSVQAIFGLYASSPLVLTNRLHSFLFALSQGALAVVVTDPATHGKIVGIIEEMGLPELLVPLDGLTPAALAVHTQSIELRRDEILRTVRTYFDAQAERIDNLLDVFVGAPVRTEVTVP